MAKARGKKPIPKTQRGTNDAQRLAAIRWLAMRIEQVSIEVVVTHRDKFDEVEAALRDAVKRLKQMGRPDQPIGGEDCPEGYVLCRDGLCAPMCDDFNTTGAPGRPRKTRR